jgi:anthranilate synthase/aminodeoxychorismate synthase-like glutamine amidotransferase
VRIVLIDNYDSFTYNLVQYLGSLGADVRVFRNDHVDTGTLGSLTPSAIVISPGPGSPEKDSGISNEVFCAFSGKTPILGVCLGQQCLGHVFGARVIRANVPMHGKLSRVRHDGQGIFEGLPNPFNATRYHSLVVEQPLPDPLISTAHSLDDGACMGLRHRHHPTYGVQFHPESILTEGGMQIISNFVQLSRSWQSVGNRV